MQPRPEFIAGSFRSYRLKFNMGYRLGSSGAAQSEVRNFGMDACRAGVYTKIPDP